MAKKEAPPLDFNSLVGELRALALEERAAVANLQKEIQLRLERAGNLEGAIITASHTFQTDKERALAQLVRAKTLLKQS